MTISSQSATVLLTIFNNYPTGSSNYYRENLNKPKLNKESNELLIVDLTAIPRPFKKVQKYNNEMRRKSGINHAQSSK